MRRQKLPFQTARELCETAEPAQFLLWPFLLKGGVTDFYGAAKKAGKSTLLLHFVDSVLHGKPFLGRPAASPPSPVVYLTEEPPGIFKLALERAGLATSDHLHVLTWSSVSERKWSLLINSVCADAEDLGAPLLVVDTLPQFTLGEVKDENSAADAKKALAPLQKAASKGLSVVIVRHTAKGGGNGGRGSGFYTGAVDVICHVKKPPRAKAETYREVCFDCRVPGVPEKMILDFDGTDYSLVKVTEAALPGQLHGADIAEPASDVLDALKAAAEPLTITELVDMLDQPKTSVWRELKRLHKAGEARRTGSGKSSDPYRYNA